MSTYVANGNGYHRSAVNTHEDLNAYLFMLKDVYNPVEQVIDMTACRTDGKEQDLIEGISVFVKDNLPLFKRISSEEKIAIIFDAYRDAYLEVFKDDQNYQKALWLVKRSPMQYFGSPIQLEQAVEWLVLRRLKIFHSITPANAIEKYMGLTSISFTGFPDTYVYRDCNRRALIDFFKKTIKT
jgi:hypothetical protein